MSSRTSTSPSTPGWPVMERSAIATVLGLPGYAAILIALGFTALGVFVDLERINGLGTIFKACYFLGCVLAVCWVKRRALFGPLVQPPLLLAFCVPAVVLVAGSEGGGTGMAARLLNIGTPLLNGFPTMAVTTAIVLLIGIARYVRQKASARPEGPVRERPSVPIREPVPATTATPKPPTAAAAAPAKAAVKTPAKATPGPDPSEEPTSVLPPATDGRPPAKAGARPTGRSSRPTGPSSGRTRTNRAEPGKPPADRGAKPAKSATDRATSGAKPTKPAKPAKPATDRATSSAKPAKPATDRAGSTGQPPTDRPGRPAGADRGGQDREARRGARIGRPAEGGRPGPATGSNPPGGPARRAGDQAGRSGRPGAPESRPLRPGADGGQGRPEGQGRPDGPGRPEGQDRQRPPATRA